MRKNKRIGILLVAFTLFITSQFVPANTITAASGTGTIGTTYYISNSIGNDSNNGTSADTPWKSFAHVKNLRLAAGDKVLLKRGDEWNERLAIYAPNGTSADWVYIGAYGSLIDDAPAISLNNAADDIGILVQDLVEIGTSRLNYVWIDNITVKNSTLGIYFRYAVTEYNQGVRVTDCTFENIYCTRWDTWLANGTETNATMLAKVKGALDSYYYHPAGAPNGEGTYYLPTGGGVYEYFIPTALFIGGKPLQPISNTHEGTRTSNIEIERIKLYNCNSGIASSCYWSEEFPNWAYTKNWKIKDIYGENTNSIFWMDNADFGWDGTDNSKWGIFKNINVMSGKADVVAANGTAQGCIITGKNLLVTDSVLGGTKNNGYPDGAGFDFERNCININLRDCVLANNDGQGVMMMCILGDAGPYEHPTDSGNSNCSVENTLFYNNLQNVYGSTYSYDFQIFNPNNSGIIIKNNYYVFKPYTSGNATVIANGSLSGNDFVFAPVGPNTTGATLSGNNYTRSDSLPSLESCVSTMGLANCFKTFTLIQKSEDSEAVISSENNLLAPNWEAKWGGWQYTNGVIENINSNNSFNGWGINAVRFTGDTDIDKLDLSCKIYMPTAAELAAFGGTDMWGNITILADDSSQTFFNSSVDLSWGSAGVKLKGTWIATPGAGNWTNDGKWHNLHLVYDGSTVTAQIYGTSSMLTGSIDVSTGSFGGKSLRIGCNNKFKAKFKDLKLNADGITYAPDSVASSPYDWKQTLGGWTLVNGTFSLSNTLRNDGWGNAFLDNKHIFLNNYTASFTIDTQNTANYNNVSFAVYDAANNRYTHINLYWKKADCFAKVDGGGQMWIAGSWCNFSGTSSYEVNASLTSSSAVISVGSFSTTVNLSSATWTSGKPGYSFRIASSTGLICNVSNIKLASTDIAYDYYKCSYPADAEKVMLLGHSQAWWWDSFGEDFAPSVTMNGGISGSVVADWYKADNNYSYISAFNPDKILIFIGFNDLQVGHTIEAVSQDIITYLNSIKTCAPNSEIYFISMIPTTLRTDLINSEKVVNSSVKAYCDQTDKVSYIDIFDEFLNMDGTPNDSLFFDHVHPNDSGYEVITAVVVPFLNGKESAVSASDWTSTNGNWNLVNGRAVLTDRTNSFLGNYFLDYKNELGTTYDVSLTVKLPKGTTDRNCISYFLYDSEQNKYTKVDFYWGANDCFAIAPGKAIQWIAGGWCNFSGTPSYNVTVKVKETYAIVSVGSFSVNVNLSDATWTEGKPSEYLRIRTCDGMDVDVRNILISSNSYEYSYQNFCSGYGDANGNSTVDMTDLIAMKNHMMNKTVLDNAAVTRCTGKTDMEIADLLAIKDLVLSA